VGLNFLKGNARGGHRRTPQKRSRAIPGWKKIGDSIPIKTTLLRRRILGIQYDRHLPRHRAAQLIDGKTQFWVPVGTIFEEKKFPTG